MPAHVNQPLDKRKVFTTGQIADICQVAPRTVSKWIDSGRIKGFRIPGSNDRRVVRKELIRFLTDNGMPLGELAFAEQHKLLLVGIESVFAENLNKLLPPAQNYHHEQVHSSFDLGLKLTSYAPDLIILDLSLGRSEAMRIAQSLRENRDHARTVIFALASEDETAAGELLAHGFTEVYQKPVNTHELAGRVDAFFQAAASA